MCTKIVDRAMIRTMDLLLLHQKHCPLGFQALPFALLQSILFQQKAFFQGQNNIDHSKMNNENVKKSREKSKKVLEEKFGQAINLLKKDQHVYNDCYELSLRAIKIKNEMPTS